MRAVAVAVAVLLTVSLAAEPIALGPERPLVAAPIDFAPGLHLTPRVAASDDGALAIWTDFRRDPYAPAVYGTRLDRDGNPLDPTGILIAANARAGDVIWTGRHFLIAYRQHPSVLVRTMTPDGVLGPPRHAVNTDWINAETIRMATNGEDVVLVTNAGRGAVLSLEGEYIRSILYDRPDLHHIFAVDVAAAGSSYAIVSVLSAGIRFYPLDGIPRTLPDSAGATTVAIASDGEQFLVVWDEVNLLALPVAPSGDSRGPQQPLTNDVAPANSREPAAHSPTLVWTGSDYLLTFAFTAASRTGTLRLRRDGVTITQPDRFSTYTRTAEPDAAVRRDGSGVIVWVSLDRAVRAASLGSPSIHSIAQSAGLQKDVRIARHGGTFVSAWLEQIGQRWELRLTRGLGARPVTVVADEVNLVDVVVEDDVVWVVWTKGYTWLFVRRYTTSLQPIDAQPFKLDDFYGEHPSVAGGGGVLLVAWMGSSVDTEIMAAVLRPAGETLAVTSVEYPEFMHNDTLPAAAWNGSEFVIAWAHATLGVWWQFPEPVDEHVVAMRVGTDGVVRDPVPLVVSDEPKVIITNLKAASAQGAVGLVWQTQELPPTHGPKGTRAARFEGAERPPRRILDNPANLMLLSLASHGEKFLMLRDRLELFLLSATLEVEEAVPVANGTSDADVVSAAGVPVVAYARPADMPQYGGVPRIFVRTTEPGRRRAIR